MDIKAVIHEKYEQMEIHVCNHDMNSDVKDVMDSLHEMLDRTYIVKDEKGDSQVLTEKDIISAYAQNQRVFIRTLSGVYETTMKLYELEERMDGTRFLRISRAEVVNIKKIKRLDLGMAGTIKVILIDNSETFTSRRNVSKLKQALGV